MRSLGYYHDFLRYQVTDLIIYPTISWTVSKTRNFFADLRHENNNRNTTKCKTIPFVKRKSNLFNTNREENIQFRSKTGRGYTGGGARVYEKITPRFRTNLGTVNT